MLRPGSVTTEVKREMIEEMLLHLAEEHKRTIRVECEPDEGFSMWQVPEVRR